MPIRDAERELNIPRSTIQRILRATLRISPYRISFLQQLIPSDYRKRLEFAQHCRREMRDDAGYMNRIAWPLQSPDLTPLDFFLWDHVKGEVYSVPIKSLNHLKSRIRQAIRRIDPSVLAKVWKNTKMGLNHVVRLGGGHIEQLVI